MTEKAFNNYEYDTPLPVAPPRWSTDRDAGMWNKSGYSANKLPAGIYELEVPYGSPAYLNRISFSSDSLVDLPDDPSSEVLEHIQDFWSKEQKFRELNITYKRGIILYGPPGSGKSATIYRLAAVLEQADAVMIMAQSAGMAKAAIEIVKSLEPKRKIVVILEDIDGIISRYGDESMTHLLDGGTDVDSVLFLATTNYPERIPARLLNRPSRFDVVIKIAMPSEAARAAYIQNILGFNLLIDIEEIVTATAGLSLAEVKEVIILTQIFEHTVQDAVSKITDHPLK